MKNIVIAFFVGFLVSCGIANKAETQSEIKVIEAYHQSWVAGVRGGGGGINFNLALKSELPKEIKLKRLIFKGFEAPFVQQDALIYQAAIITGVNQERFEGNEKNTTSSPKNNRKIQDNEAILVFSKNGKEYQQKITNVVEQPALEYPSAKPKF